MCSHNQALIACCSLSHCQVRVYEKVGAGMDWHVDDVLYDPPQVEVVYTLENTSDCTTRWKLPSQQESNMVVITKETDPNSIILLKAGIVEHCVTPLKKQGGRRVIVKCAYIAQDAILSNETLVTQFASSRKNKKRKQGRTKKR